jgi:arginine/lysine/ornithine decarboxylase
MEDRKDQRRAPLWDAMLAYRNRGPVRFHVPGHKGGTGLDPEAAAWLSGVCELDVTELSGLDDLHKPEGVIAEAEALAAACFGAERTRFLVGGSTAGNLAFILAVSRPGDVLIVQRDAHRSVYNGLMLAGARAVLLEPRLDPRTGLPCGLRADDVERALAKYPEAAGLVVTDPNYYGFGTDLAPIVAAAHRRGVPVLVDAAHGAHYGFHPQLPPSPLASGADAVVQSAHKMLPAMTMGALLHMQGRLLDREAVERALSAIQTSSPSYPVMASLDLARRQMATGGAALLERALRVSRLLADGLAARPWLEAARPESAVHCDPLKVTFRDRTGRLGGRALAARLEARNCWPEMADPVYVTLALGLSTSEDDIRRLLEALDEICAEPGPSEKELGEPIQNIYKSPLQRDGRRGAEVPEPVAFRFLRAGENASRSVPPEDAVGAVCAAAVVPYPPGVPLIVPGETVTAEAVRLLRAWQEAGAGIHGLNRDGTINIRTDGVKP